MTLPWVSPENTSVWAQYTMQVPERDRLQAALQEKGVPTEIQYPIPLILQPAAQSTEAKLPVGDVLATRVISLTMHPFLDGTQQMRIAKAIGGTLDNQ